MSISLNLEQTEAITHTGSPLLVIAGPGSGKTSVIIQRVLYLLKNGLKPSEILCLTFSEKAAEEMKQRLEKLTDITDMDISTFHSFAKQVLEDNILDSGIGMSSGVASRSTQLVWGLKNIDNFAFEHLEIGNNAVELIESIIDGIKTFKDDLIFPDKLQKYIDSKLASNISDDDKDFILKLNDLNKVYYKYQEFQREKAVIDFADMIFQTTELFKRKQNVLTKYQKRYKHVLVDEFQDNNYAQLELVKQIAKDGNVTVVGDDDQSIYRFQGAYLTNFTDFSEHYPNRKKVVLNRNYRSSENIVKLASQLLDKVPQRETKKLYSEHKEKEKIVIRACAHESAEVEFVIKTITDLIGKSIDRRDGSKELLRLKDFVILSRRKLEGRKFAKALKAHGLNATFVGEMNIFSSPIIRDLMAYLKIANCPTTSGIEITRLMKNHGITEQNIGRINHAALRKARNDETDMDFVLESLKNCHELDITQKNEVLELAEQIEKIIKLESKLAVSDIIYKIMMSVSDLYKSTLLSNTLENKKNQMLLKELYQISLEYESLNPQGTLDDFLKYLKLMGQFDLELQEGGEVENSIQVSTIHQSKGKEFPVVFIVDVATNRLPLRYESKTFYVPNDLTDRVNTQEDEKLLYEQEERRLFYVAMTRAQNCLFITYSKRYGQNVRETKHSKFLDEIEFESNPVVDFAEFEGTTGEVILQEEEKIEAIKQRLQNEAIRSLNSMNLKTAVQRIVELAKIKHFEEKNTTRDFDPTDILKVQNNDTNLDKELVGEKVPLINKDIFSLNATKVGTYLECPLKFKFAHIWNVPQPPKTFFDIGTAVHAVAEHLTDLQKDGTEPTEKLAFDIFSKEWNPNAFEFETQENQGKNKAKEMVKTYLKWSEENPNKPIDVEKEFSIMINGIKFNGKIDRVEKRPDGEYEVVDFKTGAVYKNKTSIREDPQMNIYAMGVEKVYGKLPKKASLFYIREEKIIPYEIDSAQVEKVKSDIVGYVNNILDEKFEATPSYKACRYCDYWDLCDEKETSE